jgi:hypothetical protein
VGISSAWTFGVVTGQLSYHPSDDWGLELNLDRQPIESVQAVQNHILVNTVNFGGFGLLPDFGTVAASYFNQTFSDGNNRNGFVTRITPEFYSFNSVPISVGIQGYYRYYESGRDPRDGYFSPQHYSETIGYVGYQQKFLPLWTIQIHAGVGSQTVDNATLPVKDFFGTVTGSLSPYFNVDLKGGYSQVASFYGGGSGYSSSYVQADISVPF